MPAIPSLGVTGWIVDVPTQADYIMSCWLTTNTSMSVMHREQNTSLQYILKETANQPVEMETRLQDVLSAKLKTVFGDSADAEVEVVALDDKAPDNYSIRFVGKVYDQGRELIIGKIVQFQNSRIVSIAQLLNG